jgi:hypothetical protein
MPGQMRKDLRERRLRRSDRRFSRRGGSLCGRCRCRRWRRRRRRGSWRRLGGSRSWRRARGSGGGRRRGRRCGRGVLRRDRPCRREAQRQYDRCGDGRSAPAASRHSVNSTRAGGQLRHLAARVRSTMRRHADLALVFPPRSI